MKYCHDPEGLRLPIKLDTSSNGEYEPIPLERVHHHANFLARETADTNAKRLGLDRRSFLVSACGVAGSLLGMNTAYAQQGKRGGYRTIVAYRVGNRAVFLFGFAKSGKASLDPDEFDILSRRGAVWLGASRAVIERALMTDELKEVDCGEDNENTA